MSFLRHGKSIVPMLAPGGSDRQGSLPPIIVAMSFNRLFLGGLLSSRARLRFTGCHSFCNNLPQLAKPAGVTITQWGHF